MAEYREREIFAYGRYIHCQILNWQDGPPPKYLICNPLDARYREEFLAHQAMGTWAQCDLRHVLADYAALLDELSRLREVERRAKTVCESHDRASLKELPAGGAYFSIPAKELNDLTRAVMDLRRALSEREGQE